MKTFEDFWKTYPKRIARGAAEKAYEKAIKSGADHETIMRGLNAYMEHLSRNPRDREFIKHGATWLNQKCWMDEYDAPDWRDEMRSIGSQDNGPNHASEQARIEGELLDELFQTWGQKGRTHWWHMAQMMKLARRLAGYRAHGKTNAKLESHWAAKKLPDDMRDLADWQTRQFGDTSKKDEAA